MKHSPNLISTYSTAKSFTDTSELVDNSVQFLSTVEKENSKQQVENDPISNSFRYYINEYGCRGHWKLSPTTKKFGFFGCSFTFGVGVDEQHTFPKVIENHYNHVECLNFGQGGSSIQRIAKIVSTSIRLFDFDTVVITLPSIYRFLVTDDDNNYIDVVPNYTFKGRKETAVYKCFTDLDFISMYTDYIYWMIAETKGIKKVVWGTYDPITCDILQKITNDVVFWHQKDNINCDLGRDGMHPGINSHKMYAAEIIKRLDNA